MEVLDRLVAGARDALGDALVGVYLRGSLALGDYDPATSDIDFLVVTEAPLDESQFEAVARVHESLSGQHLEGSYIDRASLRRFQPHGPHPSVGDDWEFGWHPHRENWVLECWVVRECGVALCGPAPATLIDPISADALCDAVRAELRVRLDDWAALDVAPEWLEARNYQAFEVETLCRALFTLEHGSLPTKPAAVRWARGALPRRWAALVARSQDWRADETRDPSGFPEVAAFARWVGEYHLGR